MDQLEALRAQQSDLRAKLQPIWAQLREIDTRITEQLRERRELIYVDYVRYGSLVTEEFNDLEDAMATARGLQDNGDGLVERVYGKGFSYTDCEWDD